MDRRSFLVRSGVVSAVLPFTNFFSRALSSSKNEHILVSDPAGILDLPQGFTYKIIQRSGEQMTSGGRIPTKFDGTGFFVDSRGDWILMRNHEYDYERKIGGVLRIVLDPQTLRVKSTHQVLKGTDRNCNGGITPWGWMSCEESTHQEYGWVYLCPIEDEEKFNVKKIPSYGRFCHEAVELEARTNIAYQTEDEVDGCFYRFVPNNPSQPFEGKLQALKIKGRNHFDTNNMRVGDQLQAEWVEIQDPLARNKLTREQAADLGAAIFNRGEGMANFKGDIFFSATEGGPRRLGQIFSYTPVSSSQGILKLVAMSQNDNDMDCPDGITCAPNGDIFIAEDGSGNQYVRVAKNDGSITDFAKNALSQGEFSGVRFSNDGKVLFLNLMDDGITVAITGPFDQF